MYTFKWKKIAKHGGDARVLGEMIKHVCYSGIADNPMFGFDLNIYSKWRTTPVVEEVFAEALAQVAAVVAVDAAGAVEGAAVLGVASPKTRR